MATSLRIRTLFFALLLLLMLWALVLGAFEPEARAQGAEEDRFVPSEEVSADKTVSFPVDI